MAQFSIATNFEDKLLLSAGEMNKQHSNKVIEIYGSLPMSVTGSARDQAGLPQIAREDLSNHIKLAQTQGLKFNYLMNARGGIKLADTDYVHRVNEEIDFLMSAGIDSLTIADDSLIEFVRQTYPKIELHLSIIRGVSTTEEVKRYVDKGIKVITLNQHTVNRDFKRIEEMVSSFPEAELRLYANISCLADCLQRDRHYNYLSKQSQSGSAPFINKPDLYIIQCALIYLRNPTELLKSPFIRPEDIAAYEQLGIKTFKLSDRRESTSALVNLLQAYLAGEFHGNLFDLLFREGRKWTNSLAASGRQSVPSTNIFIDNDKLSCMQFLPKIRGLTGEELESFYREGTAFAVRGIPGQQTKQFEAWIRKFKSE